METYNIRPSAILYSQTSIRSTFQNGESIIKVLDKILNDRMSILSIPMIRVKRLSNGRYLSIDNRRLWVFKQLEDYGKINYITVEKIDWVPKSKWGYQSFDINIRGEFDSDIDSSDEYSDENDEEYHSESDEEYYDESDDENYNESDEDECDDESDEEYDDETNKEYNSEIDDEDNRVVIYYDDSEEDYDDESDDDYDSESDDGEDVDEISNFIRVLHL